jgi:lipopolysaccharide heptosyltransferase II
MRSDWSTAANVLCVRLDSLGDVLMTTPAIRALKTGRAGRRITLLSSASGAAIGRLVPELDDVMVYDAPWMKSTRLRENGEIDRQWLAELRGRAFDAAVIFTVFSQSPLPAALMCHLADIPLRLAHCRENPYQLLTDWIPETEPQQGIRHEVQRQLDLVAQISCHTPRPQLSLTVPRAAAREIEQWLDRHNVAGNWVAIHPGATAPSRRYPVEQFATVADELVQRGYDVVLTGDAGERELTAALQAAMSEPSLSLAGELALPELAALIARAPLLITNNTGPAHIAAAVGTPVVDLYALTNPQHTPWQSPHRVLFHDVPCRHCFKSVCPEGHHACLREVQPAAVVQAALELLHEASARRPVLNCSAVT